jgi:hypothetical protein
MLTFLHLSYQDGTGGSDNLVTFFRNRNEGLAASLRVNCICNFKDVAFTDDSGLQMQEHLFLIVYFLTHSNCSIKY